MSARRQWVSRFGGWALCVGLLGMIAFSLGAATAMAQDDDDVGGCYYQGRIYPDGTVMCQGDVQVRCEDNDWSDIGDCNDPGSEMPPTVDDGDGE